MSNRQLCHVLVVGESYSGPKAMVVEETLHNYSPVAVDSIEPQLPHRMEDEVRYEQESRSPQIARSA